MVTKNIGPQKNTTLALLANRYVVHATILIVACVVLGMNLHTKNALAEDLSRKTLLAELIAPDDEEIIIETFESEGAARGIDTIAVSSGALAPSPTQLYTTTNSLESVPDTVSGGSAILKPTIAQTTESGTPRKANETYIVQDNDTISTIAEKFNISASTILWANNLSARSIIRPGDKLTILPINGVAHKVKKNETLGSIAQRYDIEAKTIQDYNRIADASLLSVGQTLIIPDGKPIPVARSTSRVGSSGSFSAPPSSNAIASANGLVWPAPCRRINQYYHLRHLGLDIDNCSSDDAIYAAADGRVETAGWSTRGYGNHVIINHGNGTKTLYAHLKRLFVSRGQQVTQGQTIGIMGTTGHSTGIHLHYEVRINNRPKNPFNFY